MGDRIYRPWIIEQIFSGVYNWTLSCRDETGACKSIPICKNAHNGLALEKMLNKPTCEWAGMHCGYTVLNTNVEAIICVWAEPAEIRGQEEFRGFRVDGKLYFFENAYSVFVEEEM